MCTKVWFENVKRRDNSKTSNISGRIILKWIFGKLNLRVWAGFMWLRTGTSGRLF
jgi:hypothetical protein